MSIESVITSKEDPTKLFDLIEELAVGSYGHVYKAIYKPTQDVVALKIIQLEEDDTFEEMMIEILILQKCSDKNIVKYFGSWKKGEELFIAMELCDGGSANDLYQILETPLTEMQNRWITHQSLCGLAYLHKKGIIHRDIKAANILLTESGQVKLTDFGVSAQMASPHDKRRTFIGTPYWIAPEVVNTVIAPYNEKCDLWSLGITCIEMAELQPPLHEIAPMTAVMQIPKNPPPRLKSPSSWSPEFNDFLKECFVKDPDQRKSAEELLKHPWFAGIEKEDGTIIKNLIMLTRDAEKAFITAPTEGRDSMEISDDDLDESEKSESGEAASPTVAVEAPVAVPSPPMRMATIRDSPQWGTMTEEEKRKALHEERKTKERAAEQNRRPTLSRTLKSNGARAVVKKKVLKQQIKQLGKLMKAHEQQQQRQLKAHQEQLDQLKALHDGKLQNQLKEVVRVQKRKEKEYLTETDTQKREHSGDQRQMKREHENDKKKSLRDIKEEQKRLTKDFKTQQKVKEKTYQDEKKRMKKEKASPEALKNLDTSFKNSTLFDQLLFSQKIAMEEKKKDNSMTLYQQRQQCQKSREQQQQQVSTGMKQFREMQKFDLANLQTKQQTELENIAEQLALEQRQLQEQQALQKEQVLEHHRLVTEQQHRQHQDEERVNNREFKEMQKKQTKEWQKANRSVNRVDKRSKLNEFKRKQQQEEVTFLENALKRRQELERETQQQQADQLSTLSQQHTMARDALSNDQRERQDNLKQQHEKQMHDLLRQQHVDRMSRLRQDHFKQITLAKQQQEDLLASLRTLQEGELELQRQHHQQQLTSQKDFSRTEEERANDLNQLIAEQREHEAKMRDEFTNIIKWMLTQHQEEKDAMIKEGGAYASPSDAEEEIDEDLALSLSTPPPPLPPSPRLTGEFDDMYNSASPHSSLRGSSLSVPTYGDAKPSSLRNGRTPSPPPPRSPSPPPYPGRSPSPPLPGRSPSPPPALPPLSAAELNGFADYEGGSSSSQPAYGMQ